MLAVELKLDNAAARRFVDALTLFGIGFSWGGFESLVQLVDHSLLEPHGYWPRNDNAIIRLHIGLESPSDLIADIKQALDQAAG
jgi:cystathionine beta-lyase